MSRVERTVFVNFRNLLETCFGTKEMFGIENWPADLDYGANNTHVLMDQLRNAVIDETKI